MINGFVDYKSVLVDLVVILEEHEVDSHVAVECAEFVDELLLIHIFVNVNTVYELEKCSEVSCLNSSELVVACVSLEKGIENALIIEVFGDSYLESHVSLLGSAEVELAEEDKYSAENDEE